MEQTNIEGSKGYQVTGDVEHLGDNYYSSSPIAVSVIIDETLPPIRDWIDRPEPEIQIQAWLNSDQIRLVGIVGAGGFAVSNAMAGGGRWWLNFVYQPRTSRATPTGIATVASGGLVGRAGTGFIASARCCGG